MKGKQLTDTQALVLSFSGLGSDLRKPRGLGSAELQGTRGAKD